MELEERIQGLKADCTAWTEQVTAAEAHIQQLEEQLKAAQTEADSANSMTAELQKIAAEVAAKATCERTVRASLC